jgi:hypothetical protein
MAKSVRQAQFAAQAATCAAAAAFLALRTQLVGIA